jgi:hypothetical protein
MTSPLSDPSRYRSIQCPEERAMAIAVAAHQGQRDKAGEPFIYHLFRVMLSVEGAALRQVALLHDLLEDTTWTAGDLSLAGLSQEVIQAIELLTRQPSDSYTDYVVRLSKNTYAKASKIADLNDNYRLDRVAFRAGHETEDSQRIARYILSHDYLYGRMHEAAYRERMKAYEDEIKL